MTTTTWLDELFGAGRSTLLANATTGTTDDVATTDANGAVSGVRFSGVAPAVTGFASGTGGRKLLVLATGGPLVLADEDAGSLAENRIVTGTGGDVTIAEGSGATLVYDATSSLWRLTGDGAGGGFTAPTGTGLVTVTSDNLDVASRPIGAGFLTWAATPSGANLAALLTTPLPISKGGTGNAGTASAVAALEIDWTLSGVFTKTLAAGGNTFTFANAASGMCIVVRLTSNGGGSTVTWPTVLWAGGVAPTQTPTGVDVYTFVHDGTSIYGSVVQAMA